MSELVSVAIRFYVRFEVICTVCPLSGSCKTSTEKRPIQHYHFNKNILDNTNLGRKMLLIYTIKCVKYIHSKNYPFYKIHDELISESLKHSTQYVGNKMHLPSCLNTCPIPNHIHPLCSGHKLYSNRVNCYPVFICTCPFSMKKCFENN